MKVLENILKILARIANIPLAVLYFIVTLMIMFLMMLFSMIEFFTVMPIYYVLTGHWYYDSRYFKYPYRNWFPIANNMGSYIDIIPCGTIDEDKIDLSKYYGRDKEHTSL